jgi:hypothetical protein
MKAIENLDFGLLIAYVIPGFVGLYAMSFYSKPMRSLLGSDRFVPQGGAVVPLVLLAIAAGISINAIAWATLRLVIQATGVARPNLNYALLTQEKSIAFQEIIQSNFHYYQYYVNTLTAFILLFVSYAMRNVRHSKALGFVGAVGLIVILFFASRDSLQRTYSAMDALLKTSPVPQEKKGAPP